MKLHLVNRAYVTDIFDIDQNLLQSKRRVLFSIPEEYIKFELGVEVDRGLTESLCERIVTELKTRGIMPQEAAPISFVYNFPTECVECIAYDFSFKPVEVNVQPPTIIVGNS